jgi:hypothetical protein
MVTPADTNEAHAKACADLAEKSGPLHNDGPFTPWVYREPGAPPVSSVIFPGAIGGTDWGGMSADPRSNYVFVNTSDYASIGWIEKMPATARVPYDQRSAYGAPVPSKFWDRKTDANGALMGSSSWPCQKPPWGYLTAVNANTETTVGDQARIRRDRHADDVLREKRKTVRRDYSRGRPGDYRSESVQQRTDLRVRAALADK